MVAKAVGLLMFDTLRNKLRPVQLGCGTKAGCEAAVHAARTYLSNASESKPRILLKMDFRNAFNTLRRDKLLTEIREQCPHLYKFIWQAYSAPSTLFFGRYTLDSATGVQQGDPLGPALFSLAIQSLVTTMSSEVNIWYLDDGSIGGETNQVLSDLQSVKRMSSAFGLQLNEAKCELMLLGMNNTTACSTLSLFQQIAPTIRSIPSNEAILLGAPLSTAAIGPSFQPKIDALSRLTTRLNFLHTHDALYLLRNCVAIPKLLYLLCTSPTWKRNEDLESFDEIVKLSLQSISNVKMEGAVWQQATLPSSMGGLGVRKSVDIALPAFLSSAHASQDLVTSILPLGEPGVEALSCEAADLWEERFCCPLPPVESRGQQRAWDSGPLETLKNQLYNSTNDPVAKASLLSVSTKEAGAWLNVLPAPHLGTKLDDTTVRIAIGLRLGANIVEEHRCICGAPVHRNGTHGLSCRKSGGRIPRHQAANETLRRALVSGGVPSILEPVGVCREDAKRPDGMTLIPWEGGRSLLWDFTSCDTLVQSHKVRAVRGTGYRRSH